MVYGLPGNEIYPGKYATIDMTEEVRWEHEIGVVIKSIPCGRCWNENRAIEPTCIEKAKEHQR
jgi:hypothetical protein